MKELCALKNLHSQIDAALEDITKAHSLSDETVLNKTIEQLQPTLDQLKPIDSKILEASEKNLTIIFSLKEESNRFKSDFGSILVDILKSFVSFPSEMVFTSIGKTKAEVPAVTLKDFYAIRQDFEVYASVSGATNELDSIRSTWESDILDPLVSGASFLALETNGPLISIHTTERSHSSVFYLPNI